MIAGEREFLLDLARKAVTAAVRHSPPPDPRALARQKQIDLAPRLLNKRGVFVTLTYGGHLRGCIGYIEGHKPLVDGVVDNGKSASVGDPRFPPVTPRELPGVDIEISALTPMSPSSPEDVVVGRDGILIERGFSRGLLLPQVAVENGWNAETFLDATCRKAGLEAKCWRKRGTTVSTFGAEIFGEP